MYDKGYAEGFRAGQEKLEEIRQSDLAESMKINDATSKECYQQGFNAARDKAKGIAKRMEYDVAQVIAHRIGEMEP